MKYKKRNHISKTGFPALALFLSGFLLGNLLPNLMWRLEWKQKTMACVYLLETFADGKLPGKEYLAELFKRRGSYYFLCAASGFSVFGVPVAVIGTLLLGAELGVLLAMSILTFGLSGGLVGLGLFIPQYLVYVPVTLYLMDWVYELSLGIWKKRGLFPEKVGRFVGRFILGALAYGGGILLEGYVNPWVAEKILHIADLF